MDFKFANSVGGFVSCFDVTLAAWGIESRVQSGVVQPQDVCTCWMKRIWLPVFVNGYRCDANLMDSETFPKLCRVWSKMISGPPPVLVGFWAEMNAV